MIEGSGSCSGSGSINLTSGSGSGSPKNMWIRIRIRNTAFFKIRGKFLRLDPDPATQINTDLFWIWIRNSGPQKTKKLHESVECGIRWLRRRRGSRDGSRKHDSNFIEMMRRYGEDRYKRLERAKMNVDTGHGGQ